MTEIALRPRRTFTSIEELVAGASSRQAWKNADSLSGSALEKVEIDGQPYVLKHLHLDDDWIQRALGDLYTRPLLMWRSGLFDALPTSFDHTIVGVTSGLGRNGWGAAVLMRDVSPWMIDVTAGLIDLTTHLRFLDHMAELHARFWGWEDTIGLQQMSTRYFVLSPLMARCESERGDPDPVPAMVPEGWERIREEAPALAKIVIPLLDDPWPLVAAQQRGPSTLIHSDWKAGNLGALPDGRTVLLDWAFPGRAPAVMDLAWYLAVNCELLPHSKEEAIEAYRSYLQTHGIDIDSWWEPQLALALLGGAVLLAWSKSGNELAWWEDRAARARVYLD